MTDSVLQHYTQAAELLDAQDVMASPAELHGVLTGMLCGGASLEPDVWMKEFNELVNDGTALPTMTSGWLEQVFNETLNGLTQQSGLQLLVPEDEEELEERLLALCDWAQAFLAGFAVIQQDLSRASEELQEMLGDISSITQLEQDMEEDAESEASYIVIYEHLKLGAMMAFEEFGQRPAKPAATPTLH